MCEKKLPESVEKGVLPLLFACLLCMHVSVWVCVRVRFAMSQCVLISPSCYKQDVATTIICIFISKRCSLFFFLHFFLLVSFLFKMESTNVIAP